MLNRTAARIETPAITAMPFKGLQRQCACGGTPRPTGECAECRKKRESEVSHHLRAPLDAAARVPVELRFHHDYSRVPLQTKLAIGASNDPLEKEADRIAEQVLAAPLHDSVTDGPLRIQRFSGETGVRTDTTPTSIDQAFSSPGQVLEPALRQDMERRFGHDFSLVRVHSDSAAERSAREINAHAYTVGDDIIFAAGRFAPETNDGRRLLAHELTHVVQQGSAKKTDPARFSIQKTSKRQVMRSLVLDSTVNICHRELTSRNIVVSRGGLKVVLLLTPLDTTIRDCQNHNFWVTLTRSVDWGFDDEIATCQGETGGNRSFSFGKLSSGTYYLTINRAFDHPYCCIEGDILVFDEPVSSDSSSCERDKDPSALDIVHAALDVAGFIPVLGAIPDGINAGIYSIEGDWANAGLSAVAMVPAWGDGVKLGAIAGKSAIKISEKAAIKLGEEGIAKGLKEVKAASKVEKATVEATETVEKEAIGAAATGEKKAAAKAEKEAAKTLEQRIAECLIIYAAYDKLGDCKGCKGTDTPSERASKIACLTAEIAGRTAYLEKDCDDVLQGSIDRKIRGGDPKGGHRKQLAEKIQALAKCATLPTKSKPTL